MNAPTSSPTSARRAAIAEMVAAQGFIGVADLVEKFGVNPATVRRDLQTLEANGQLRRVHGGAVPPAAPPLTAAAERIGRAAAGILAAGDTVFLGPGPLTLAVAYALAAIPRLTVVTNGLQIAHHIATTTSHTLIVTGGQAGGRDLGLTGPLTRSALATLRADHVILELDGINAADGLTDDDLSQAETARLLLATGAHTIALVSAERVGRVAAAFVAPASEIDTLVTTREAPPSHLWDLSEAGLRVVLA